MKVATLSKMQFIGLQWAKLARSILCFGVTLTFHNALVTDMDMALNHKNKLMTLFALIGKFFFIFLDRSVLQFKSVTWSNLIPTRILLLQLSSLVRYFWINISKVNHSLLFRTTYSLLLLFDL